ncbi:MAG: S-layer homology domain-containing protein [Promicromonosporaceae bacterium]|nr:S-layer homology domain-containing protein [Promicromonosporaceae bacterium]
MRRLMLRSIGVAGLSAVLAFGAVVPAAVADLGSTSEYTAETGSFVDVPADSQFRAYITWLAEQGISTGWDDGTFRPTASVERQAMAAFLYRGMAEVGAFTAPGQARFIDKPLTSPFFRHVEWLAMTGITTGWPDNTFRPVQSVERQAMAAFLYRAAGSPSFTTPSVARFIDVPVGAPFFHEIEWLASTGITTGWPDRTFRPTQNVERQAMAAFLCRANGQGLFGQTQTCPVQAPVRPGIPDPTPTGAPGQPTPPGIGEFSGGSVSISGSATVGLMLAATHSGFQPEPTDVAWQWLRDGVAISGATNNTYLLTPADSGRRVSVQVTASGQGLTPTSRTSEEKVVQGRISLDINVVGDRTVGSTLTAVPVRISPTPDHIFFEWSRDDGEVIATGPTLLLTDADAGSSIWLITVVRRAGYTTVISRRSVGIIPATVAQMQAAEQEIYVQTNQFRGENDRTQLTWNEDLAVAARIHARAMHDRNCLWHFGFNGQGGGNGAGGFMLSLQRSHDFVDGWANSPGHRSNMLRSEHMVIGVGVYNGPSGTFAYQIMAVEATPQSTWPHQPGTPGLDALGPQRCWGRSN